MTEVMKKVDAQVGQAVRRLGEENPQILWRSEMTKLPFYNRLSPSEKDSLEFFMGAFEAHTRKETAVLLPLLKRVREMMPNHSPYSAVNAVYIPPAQAMRNAADRIEYEEKTTRELDELIKDLEARALYGDKPNEV